MALTNLHRAGWLKKIIYAIWRKDNLNKYEKIATHLKGKRVVDIGSGFGLMVDFLNKKGYDTIGLDIREAQLPGNRPPQLYDGKHMPFKGKSFDTSLILTVLHHTSNHESILLEASRISKRIIIIEDIYRNLLQKWLTFFVDSVVNWEFASHPHSNRSDRQWKALFQEIGLNCVAHSNYRYMIFFRQAVYVIAVE
ncbi:MAG: methyltransferase domain-containing protein [Bacteroidota bacterium]